MMGACLQSKTDKRKTSQRKISVIKQLCLVLYCYFLFSGQFSFGQFPEWKLVSVLFLLFTVFLVLVSVLVFFYYIMGRHYNSNTTFCEGS